MTLAVSFARGFFVARGGFERSAELSARRWRYDGEARGWVKRASGWGELLGNLLPFEGEMDGAARTELARLKALIVEGRTPEAEIPVPEGMAYRRYQVKGICFLLPRRDALLCDDMGLGKTVEVVGLSNADPEVDSVLVICPASARRIWSREFSRWGVRGFRSAILGTRRGDREGWSAQVVIVSYNMAAKYRERLLAKRPWGMVVCDEFHYLTHNGWQRTDAVLGVSPREAFRRLARRHPALHDLSAALRSDPALKEEYRRLVQPPLSAPRRVFLSGTPFDNRPIELFPVLEAALDPDGLGSDRQGYGEKFCDGHRDDFGHWDFTGASNLEELRRRLAHFMIRRLKSDVLPELPGKERQTVIIEAEGALAAAVAAEREAARFYRRETAQLEAALAGETPGSREHGRLLAELHRALERHQAGISRARHELAVAKIPYVLDHVHALLSSGEGKVVVMGHHLDLIEALLAEFPAAARVVGGQSDAARERELERFAREPGCRLCVGALTAAGVAIDLSAAHLLVLAEQDWRPGVLDQAEDRLCRFGQRFPVLVQVLVVRGSLDRAMEGVRWRKREVIRRALPVAAA